MTPSPAATFSARLLREFVALGVQHVVVSPGSRSQALALAAAAAEERGSIALHVRLDERDSAFTALGLARESGRPALVVTTSGTAAANLLPAVVEASHSGVPMIVLTADRPARLRGTGSNQTTWQPGLFGRFVRAEADVEAPVAPAIPDARGWARWAFAAATGAGAGPVHLNLQFVEPLSGAVIDDDDPEGEGEVEVLAAEEAADARALGGEPAAGGAGPDVDAAPAPATATATGPAPDRSLADRPTASTSLHLPRGPRTIVIAGADAGEAANELALAAGWPLIAEVSSGSRFGPTLVGAYRTLLDDEDFGGRVERAVVFGHPTLSRQVPALLARDAVEVVVVRGPGEPVVPRPGVAVVDQVSADAEDRSDRAARAWTGQWVFAGRELHAAAEAADEVAAPLVSAGGPGDLAGSRDYARAELAALRAPITRRSLARAVWQASWPHDRLVLGASRLIRELDAVVPGKRIRVHANRGLAGIDGTVATAVGIALASQLGPRAGGAGAGAGAGAGIGGGVGAGSAGAADAGAGFAARSGAGSAAGGRSGQAGDRGRTGTTRVLLGDLTLLHDAGGLLLPPGETRPRVQLIVGNDGGGTIFDGLEVASTAEASSFDRVMFTPQRVDLAALAAAYGWQHRTVTTRGDLDSALASPPAGTSILEVPLDR